jgi:methionine-rich copper-binding protein CopC
MPKRATKWNATLLAGLTAAWLLLTCAPALAHANLVEASPPQGGEVSKPPERVELRFSEPVEAEFDPVVVRAAGGARVDAHDARVDPEDARVVLADVERLSKGSYTVKWRVTSIDGHVVEGRYGFAVVAARDTSPEGDSGAKGSENEAAKQQAEQKPAEQDDSGEGPAPILAYSALSLGAVAIVAVATFIVIRLIRRNKS